MTIEEVHTPQEFEILPEHIQIPFTQGWNYGELQKSIGRRVERYLIRDHEQVIGSFQMIHYPLLFGWGYFSIPHGPVFIRPVSEEMIHHVVRAIKRASRNKRAIFVRIDPMPVEHGKFFMEHGASVAPHYSYHSAYFQPKYEWIIDLAQPEAEIFEHMQKNARYGIKFATKKMVEIDIVESGELEQHFEIFYSLLEQTSKRDEFNMHDREYYEHYFKIFGELNSAFLIIAYYKETPLVSNFIITYRNNAYLAFSGSANEDRDLQATYLAQWAGITEAKKRGCATYNFGGIEDPEGLIYKGWKGLTHFKKKFGGQMFVYGDYLDIVTRPLLYRAYMTRKRIKES